MIYHQILTIRTLLNKVCYGFQHILATWCIHWSYPLKTNVYTKGSPFLLPYLGYNMTLKPIYFKTTGTKVFRILQIRHIDLTKFELFQTILRNQSTLTPIFSRAVYFHFTNFKT